jgi:hypothetical protein
MESHVRHLATVQQVVRLVEITPGLSARISPAKLVASHGVGLAVSWGAALRFLFAEEWDEQDADAFFVKLAYGDGLLSDDPIYKLRELLIREKSGASTRRYTPLQIAAFTIKAFNAWVMNEQLAFFRWTPGGTRREPFPQIVRKGDA